MTELPEPEGFAARRAAALDATQPPIEQLRAVVACLRAPGGCPWDREQTHASLRGGLLEEAYEVVEAINQADDANLREELGDLLLQAVFHAEIAAGEGRFDFDAVAREIVAKLIRRHPHVFGEEHCADSAAVLVRWDDLKRQEKGGAPQSVLDGLPGGLPALLHAQKTQKKAARVGFDWPDAAPVLAKLREEITELSEALSAPEEPSQASRVEDELGDLLFTVVNLARKLQVDAETALHRSTQKFSQRLRAVEALGRERGLALESMSLAELDLLWEEVKRRPV